jgi:hypothetical protein
MGKLKPNSLMVFIVNHFNYRNTCVITYLNSLCINRLTSDYCHLDLDFCCTPMHFTQRFVLF